MNEPIIVAENIGKKYYLGEDHRSQDTIRDSIVHSLKSMFNPGSIERDSFWANKDVSFSVKPGEVVGIIGRNGAGKSTLLKILSRITHPTEGRVRMRGRVGSLLEVGTGFHPELTGHENIFLSGIILGMKHFEVKKHLDKIIEFSGIEEFIHTPVKRYSSGMRVRLGFAVAAHLNPEILIVDEVLAVGDATFQKRCLSKMEEIASGSGRTVLFVSHNLNAVRNLCTRVIFLRQGTVAFDGDTESGIRAYLRSIEGNAEGIDFSNLTERGGRGSIRFSDVKVCSGLGSEAEIVTGQPVLFDFFLNRKLSHYQVRFTIYSEHGVALTHFNSANNSPEDELINLDQTNLRCKIPELPLTPGRYYINAALLNQDEIEDHIEGAAFFEVGPGEIASRTVDSSVRFSCVAMKHHWGGTKCSV